MSGGCKFFLVYDAQPIGQSGVVNPVKVTGNPLWCTMQYLVVLYQLLWRIFGVPKIWRGGARAPPSEVAGVCSTMHISKWVEFTGSRSNGMGVRRLTQKVKSAGTAPFSLRIVASFLETRPCSRVIVPQLIALCVKRYGSSLHAEIKVTQGH